MTKAPARPIVPWIPVVTVFIIGLCSFILLRQLVSQAYKADERVANIKYSDELAKRVYRAEAGVGLFLLTGDTTFTDSLKVLRTGADRQIERLRRFQGADVQTAQIATLSGHVDSLFTNIDAQVQSGKQGSLSVPIDSVRLYRGRALLRAIRADLRVFQKNENLLGSANAEWFVKVAQLSKMAVIIGMLIIIAVIIINDRGARY